MHQLDTLRLEKNLTIGTDAYTAGDVVGGLIEFGVMESIGSATIRHATLVDAHAEAADLTLYIFNDEPTGIDDDAEFDGAITVDDLTKLVAIVEFANADSVSINSMNWQRKLLNETAAAGDSNKLYGYLVDETGGTWAAAANAITIILDVWPR